MGGFANNAPIVTDGLVFYVDAGNSKSYPGSGTTWSDLVGENNGTLTNSPTFDSANGGSIVLDGVNDYIVYTNAVNISGGSGTAQTFDIWFKADVISGGLIGMDSYYNVLMVNATGEIYFQTDGDNSSGDFPTTPTLSAGVWHNIVFVYDQGTAYKGWLDGVSVGTVSITDTEPAPSLNVIIGARYAGSGSIGGYFNGNISSVKIYDRELTSSEILQNYNALKNRFV